MNVLKKEAWLETWTKVQVAITVTIFVEKTHFSHMCNSFQKEESLLKFSIEALTFWFIIQMLCCPRLNYHFI